MKYLDYLLSQLDSNKNINYGSITKYKYNRYYL